MKLNGSLLSGAGLVVLQATAIQATRLARSTPAQPNGIGYRISPIDGSKIALPTKEQLAFQEKEIGFLIHFEMGTYLSIDGCNSDPSLVPPLSTFDPELLNTDQWMDSAKALGAKYATLVAKHNCGFTTWPSKVQFTDDDGGVIAYNYTVAGSPIQPRDVVGEFVKSATKYNIDHGFYYSTVVNNFLNVQNAKVRDGALAPGQVGIANSTYDEIVLAQLSELWSKYGKLREIWFDGGYSGSQKDSIRKLLQQKQPQAVIFNGCSTDGTCLTNNSIRWIGTESGHAPEENWSTGLSNDGGDPASPYFSPAECDTTLQTDDRWFFGVDKPLRNLTELISVYHDSVGHNCVLALDLSPDRDGLIPQTHAARYKELGDFIRSCYDKPIPFKKVGSKEKGGYGIKFGCAKTFDRVVLMEDQTNGQVIRSYKVFARNGGPDASWTLISNGTSVGNKKIDLLAKPVTATEIKVTSTFVDTPVWKSVTVHSCDTLTKQMTA